MSLLRKEKEVGRPKQFLGLEYAKADFDARNHYNFGDQKNEQTIAARLFAGYGLAYGNSDVVPFVKEDFSGGPYSVRVFNIRSLGLGTYDKNKTQNASSFFDKTGNIHLKVNIEYRFPIYSFFKGAVFADAGNVWNSVASPYFKEKDTFYF
nr:BamA/TamA family outer membrane protein [Polaribacter filamentus]